MDNSITKPIVFVGVDVFRMFIVASEGKLPWRHNFKDYHFVYHVVFNHILRHCVLIWFKNLVIHPSKTKTTLYS